MITIEELNRKQSEIIQKLMQENNKLRRQLMDEQREHAKDVKMLKRILISALQEIPGRRCVLSNYTPQDAEFILEENMANDMIIILGKEL